MDHQGVCRSRAGSSLPTPFSPLDAFAVHPTRCARARSKARLHGAALARTLPELALTPLGFAPGHLSPLVLSGPLDKQDKGRAGPASIEPIRRKTFWGGGEQRGLCALSLGRRLLLGMAVSLAPLIIYQEYWRCLRPKLWSAPSMKGSESQKKGEREEAIERAVVIGRPWHVSRVREFRTRVSRGWKLRATTSRLAPPFRVFAPLRLVFTATSHRWTPLDQSHLVVCTN